MVGDFSGRGLERSRSRLARCVFRAEAAELSDKDFFCMVTVLIVADDHFSLRIRRLLRSVRDLRCQLPRF